jgi:hypothetical protein
MTADVLALSGECEKALAHLARARKRDWWNTSDYFQSPFQRSTLACLHGNAGFRRLEVDYRQRLNAERAKAAAELRRIGKAPEAEYLLLLTRGSRAP